jgi:hypothetical protein
MTERDAVISYLFVAALVALVIVIAGGGAAAYFWNCFAPDLFGASRATYRNGVGFVGFLVLVRQVTPLTVGRSRD